MISKDETKENNRVIRRGPYAAAKNKLQHLKNDSKNK